MKIIFLDIDGVMNCQNAYKEGFCQYYEDGDFFYQTFYPKAKELLNKLIDETGAKIVISSTWRNSGMKFLNKVWKLEEMSGEIIGITPNLFLEKDDYHYTIPRGCEIDYYLKKEMGFWHINWCEESQQTYMDKSGVENYIIIDDDGDMLYGQKNHFIHVLPSPRNMEGFNEKYYNLALSKLNKTVIELNYG
jgi:HAD domain in Swiss Army Knife RNA repair proteins